MFTIKDKQMRAFQQIADQSFATDIVAFLRKEIPEYIMGISDAKAAERTLKAIHHALRFQIRRDQDQVLFAALTFVIGERFFESAEYASTLDLHEVSAEERLIRIVKSLSPGQNTERAV